jgi:phage/conjugal plasmid C-4 type zinc finger TraR family protein
MVDVVDIAQATEERHRAAALAAATSDRRPPVVPAGDTCIDCADEIPEERREAEPDTRRCLVCQERRERVCLPT